MLKLLFKILQSLPAFKNLLNEYFAAERAQLSDDLKAYQARWQGTENQLAIAQSNLIQARAEIDKRNQAMLDLARSLAARDIEIERLKDEKQKKLVAVDALDSEAVFDASLNQRGADLQPSTASLPTGKIDWSVSRERGPIGARITNIKAPD